MPRWDSNPQSQQASGRRPTPETARLLGTAIIVAKIMKPICVCVARARARARVCVCVFVCVYPQVYFLLTVVCVSH